MTDIIIGAVLVGIFIGIPAFVLFTAVVGARKAKRVIKALERLGEEQEKAHK